MCCLALLSFNKTTVPPFLGGGHHWALSPEGPRVRHLHGKVSGLRTGAHRKVPLREIIRPTQELRTSLRTSRPAGHLARWPSSVTLSGKLLGSSRCYAQATAIDILAREHDSLQILMDKLLYYVVPPKEDGAALEPPAYSATRPVDMKPVDKKELLKEILREISIHKALEETYLRPVVQAVLKDSSSVIREWALRDSRLIEKLKRLHDLANKMPNDSSEWPKFPVEEVIELKECCLAHAKEMDQRVFPELKKNLTHEKLVDLGDSLERGKLAIPAGDTELVEAPIVENKRVMGVNEVMAANAKPNVETDLASRRDKEEISTL